MTNAEQNFPTNSPAERQEPNANTPLILPERPEEEQYYKRRLKNRKIMGGTVVALLTTSVVSGVFYANEARKLGEAVEQSLDSTSYPTEEYIPSPSPSPEFPPINPLSYELKGESPNTDSLELNDLKKEFVIQFDSVGEPLIEELLPALANYRPTQEEYDEFEARAQAEANYDGTVLDKDVAIKVGVLEIADMLTERAEVVALDTHAPAGKTDSLFATSGLDQAGLINKIISETQIEIYEAQSRGEDYSIKTDVLRESRVDPRHFMDTPSESYKGTLYYNVYFSVTDNNGEDRGAAVVGVTTMPNPSAFQTETYDGQEVSVLTDTNGDAIFDRDGKYIPHSVIDDAIIQGTFDTTEEMKAENPMVQ